MQPGVWVSNVYLPATEFFLCRPEPQTGCLAPWHSAVYRLLAVPARHACEQMCSRRTVAPNAGDENVDVNRSWSAHNRLLQPAKVRAGRVWQVDAGNAAVQRPRDVQVKFQVKLC